MLLQYFLYERSNRVPSTDHIVRSSCKARLCVTPSSLSPFVPLYAVLWVIHLGPWLSDLRSRNRRVRSYERFYFWAFDSRKSGQQCHARVIMLRAHRARLLPLHLGHIPYPAYSAFSAKATRRMMLWYDATVYYRTWCGRCCTARSPHFFTRFPYTIIKLIKSLRG